MPVPRFFTPRAITPFLVALILLVIAFAWDSETGTASATTAASSAGQAANSCPLPPAQQVKAAQAWAKMMPVFRHPRCLNCHGGVPDPLAPAVGTLHMGVVEISSKDDKAICEECHEEGWRLPGHLWTQKDDLEICSDMKTLFSSGQFIDHIVRDGGGVPFIEYAFKGMRGLNEGAGEGAYEDKFGAGTLKADPPPGTHAQLVQQAKDWVKAQGGSFVGDSDCGCVLDRVEVRFHSAVTIVTPRVTSTITGDGTIDLKLGPEARPTWDVAVGARGDAMTVAWSGMSISQPPGCDGKVMIKSSPASQFKLWLGMSYSPDLKLSLQIIPGADLHQVVYRCLAPNGTWIELQKNDPISLFAGAWNALHGKSAEAVALKATAAMDFNKLKTMDPKQLQAMADAMKNNPDPAAAAAQMKAFLNQTLPGASQLAAEAKNNFTFAIPDNSGCTIGTGTAFLARCDFDRTITVPAGAGPSQTITEKTTITIGKPSPKKP
jgi:hypothetical protein